MARITQSELLAEIQLWLPDFESARVEAAANLVIRTLGRRGYGFLEHRSTITVSPVTETTVTVSQGSTAVTCTDAAATWVGQVIQIEGSDTWYGIESVSAGVSCVLSSAYEGDDVTGGDATVAFWRVALPAEFIRVEEIRESNGNALAYGRLDKPSLATPSCWTLLETVNTDDALEIGLTDYPSSYLTLVVKGTRRLDRFSGSGACGIPEWAEDVLIKGTIAYCSMMEGDREQATLFFGLMEQAIRDTAAREGPTALGQMSSIRAGDGPLSVHRPWNATAP